MTGFILNHAKTWLALKADRRAVTVIEYGLIASLIAVALIATLTQVGSGLGGLFTKITTSVQ